MRAAITKAAGIHGHLPNMPQPLDSHIAGIPHTMRTVRVLMAVALGLAQGVPVQRCLGCFRCSLFTLSCLDNSLATARRTFTIYLLLHISKGSQRADSNGASIAMPSSALLASGGFMR